MLSGAIFLDSCALCPPNPHPLRLFAGRLRKAEEQRRVLARETEAARERSSAAEVGDTRGWKSPARVCRAILVHQNGGKKLNPRRWGKKKKKKYTCDKLVFPRSVCASLILFNYSNTLYTIKYSMFFY